MKTSFFMFLCFTMVIILFTKCNPSSNSGSNTNVSQSAQDTLPSQDSIKINFTKVNIDDSLEKPFAVIAGDSSKMETDKLNLTIFPTPLSKAKKLWKGLVTNCNLSSLGFNFKDFAFLGAGDPTQIGDIIDPKNELSLVMHADSNVFSGAELIKIISYGGSSPCGVKTNSSTALNVLLNGNLNVGSTDTALAGLISAYFNKNTNLVLNVNSWQKYELSTDWLVHYLQTDSNLSIKKMYLNSLLTPGNVIVDKAIYASGFSFQMGFTDSLSSAIQATLKNNPKINIGSLSLNVSLTNSKKTSITATCNSPFVVYGYLLSGTEVMKQTGNNTP
jgi:hypothetical protein